LSEQEKVIGFWAVAETAARVNRAMARFRDMGEPFAVMIDRLGYDSPETFFLLTLIARLS
jgi:hypothetical protein